MDPTPAFIWFCLRCDREPYVAVSPHCPRCHSDDNQAVMLDGRTDDGEPIPARSPLGRELRSMMGLP
jgi:hypothetical protein